MRGDKKSTEAIKVGSILQVDPKAELGTAKGGELAIVAVKHSWGVDARVASIEGTVPLSWQHVEPTGGVMVWAPDGTRFTPEGPGIAHHP